MSNSDKFPRFYYDGNQFWGHIESIADLGKLFKQYKGINTPDEILDKSRNLPEARIGSGHMFGMRSVFDGPLTLRQFLEGNRIYVSSLKGSTIIK